MGGIVTHARACTNGRTIARMHTHEGCWAGLGLGLGIMLEFVGCSFGRWELIICNKSSFLFYFCSFLVAIHFTYSLEVKNNNEHARFTEQTALLHHFNPAHILKSKSTVNMQLTTGTMGPSTNIFPSHVYKPKHRTRLARRGKGRGLDTSPVMLFAAEDCGAI